MKVGLFGANGRMGRVLIEALDQNENAELLSLIHISEPTRPY